MRSGVVLAGGGSTRFDGGDKALAEVGGVPMLERVVRAVGEAVDEVVVVAGDEGQAEGFSHLDASVVVDSVEGFGPVAGIHAGFGEAEGDYCFVTSCDLPLLRSEVVDALFGRAEGFAGAVPEGEDLEPLVAVYERGPMLEAAEAALEEGEHRIVHLYSGMGALRLVSKEDLREFDPELDSFLNVNTVEELEEAEARLSGRRDGEAGRGSEVARGA